MADNKTRFSAQLVFRFVDRSSEASHVRLIVRTLACRARDADAAYDHFLARGRNDASAADAEFPFDMTFAGIRALRELGIEVDEDEVWYDVVREDAPGVLEIPDRATALADVRGRN